MGKIKRITIAIICLIFSVSIICGCDNKKDEKKVATKGKYVESQCELPKDIIYIYDIANIKGKLYLLAQDTNGKVVLYNCDNKVKEWVKEEREFPDIYVKAASIREDKSILITYEYEVTEEEGKEEETKMENGFPEMNSRYLIIDNEGNVKDYVKDEYKNTISAKYNNKENIFLLSSDCTEIMEVDSKSAEIINTYKFNDSYIVNYELIGDSLIIITDKGAYEYNSNTGKKVKDLDIFKDYLNNINFMYSNEDSKTIYFTTEKGLFSYVMGGSVIEKLIDGSKNSIGDSFSTVLDIFYMDEAFYILYLTNSDMVLNKYEYDENSKENTSDKLTLYSLYESDYIRQILNLYQKKNPEVTIDYDYGISFEGDVSESDAIKTLNTKLLSGKGPDIVILDDLPSKQYLNKNILSDISDVINEDKDKLFSNIYNAYNDDGKVYSIPLRFKVPVIVGDNSANINNLEDLSSTIKNNKDYKGELLESYTPLELINTLYTSCSSSWINDDSVNEENIKKFLQCSKSIYDIANSKYSKTDIDEHKDYIETIIKESSKDSYYSLVRHDNSRIANMLFDKHARYSLGYLSTKEDMKIINEIKKKNEGIDYNMWSGQGESSFRPYLLVAINDNSKNKDKAKEFIKYCLSDEIQSNAAIDGFSINKEICQKYLDPSLETGESGFAIMNEKGEQVSVSLQVLNDDDVKKFLEKVEELKSPVMVDNTIINKIQGDIENYILGKKSMKKTISSIKNNLDLILKE